MPFAPPVTSICFMRLPVFGVVVVEPTAGVPLGPLIAVYRYATGVFQHLGHVHQVPGHKRRVALRKVVVFADFAAVSVIVAITWPGAGFTNPAGVRLRR